MAADFSLNTLHARMASSTSALIIVSRPVDPDCIGTARALRWLLAAQGRTASITCFFSIPSNMADFPGMDEVLVAEPDIV